MVTLPRWLRVPRPRTFLYLMSLRTGTEMISIFMIFNKITGFYGLLAVLTGMKLSPLQLSMYIYSVLGLALLAFLMPHIRKQTPFQCLALAWFYLLDTVVNTAFTSAFAVAWFLNVSANSTNSDALDAAGSDSISNAADLMSPMHNYSEGDATTASATDATVSYATRLAASAASSPSLAHGVGLEESMPSIFVVVALTLVRLYFILVVFAYARQVLRQHVYAASSTKLHLHIDGAADAPAENPFASDSQAGQGWQGKVGRQMVKVGQSYWLGGQADDAWAKGLDGKFKTTKPAGGPPGTLERERRARSGTGPPLPSANVTKV